MINPPEFVGVGHVSFDINGLGDGVREKKHGGSVSYAGLTAVNHGMKVGLVTSAGSDFDYQRSLPGIEVVSLLSDHTTTFTNVYKSNHRKQGLICNAGKIFRSDIPDEWIKPQIFFAGPLLHEISTSCLEWFNSKFSYIVPQGWFRRWSEQGLITIESFLPDHKYGKKWDLLVVSDQESSNLSKKHLLNWAKVVAVTKGSDGATIICDKGDDFSIPPFASKAVDRTGAGDVWATAMALLLYGGENPRDAGYYASAAAAISIESPGLEGCPSPDDIEKKLLSVY